MAGRFSQPALQPCNAASPSKVQLRPHTPHTVAVSDRRGEGAQARARGGRNAPHTQAGREGGGGGILDGWQHQKAQGTMHT